MPPSDDPGCERSGAAASRDADPLASPLLDADSHDLSDRPSAMPCCPPSRIPPVQGVAAGATSTTEVIRPSERTSAADLPLSGFAMIFGSLPLQSAPFNPRVFFYSMADEAALHSSLSRALSLFPMLAGRIDPKGRRIRLSDDGVPFTTVRLRDELPLDPTEEWIKLLADQRDPKRVMCGEEPVMTVQLTLCPSGRAALCFAASHIVLDGMSAFTVLNTWAAIARGEALSGMRPRTDTLPLRTRAIPVSGSAADTAKQFEEYFGSPPPCWLLARLQQFVISRFIAAANASYLKNGPRARLRLFLSTAQLNALKAAATPPGGDQWVSTQEALAAFLFLEVARRQPGASVGTPPTKSGGVRFWRDARSALGLEANHVLGTGFFVQTIDLGTDYLAQPLSVIATRIHDAYLAESVNSDVMEMQRQMNWLADTDIPDIVGASKVFRTAHLGFVLGLNNQCKVKLPDFGPAADAVEQRFITVAGPNIVVPAPGGVSVYLQRAIFPKDADVAVSQMRETLKGYA